MRQDHVNLLGEPDESATNRCCRLGENEGDLLADREEDDVDLLVTRAEGAPDFLAELVKDEVDCPVELEDELDLLAGLATPWSLCVRFQILVRELLRPLMCLLG